MKSSLIDAHLRLVVSLGLYLQLVVALPSAHGEEPVGGINIRQKIVPGDSSRLQLPVLPGASFQLLCGADTLRPGRDYLVQDGRFVLLHPETVCDTLELASRLALGWSGRQFALRSFLTEKSVAAIDSTRPPPTIGAATPSPQLKLSGTKSFSADLSDRGSVNLSQGLSLTLSGDIGHGITVRGTFSDRGLRDNRLVTRRFSELQNIYLEVESENLGGRFGNFLLREDRFHFLSLARNVQGLGLNYRSGSSEVATSISVPPGNFGTNSFLTREGDYGPYRLSGESGELGIGVLENSEEVWLNGLKLERGRDRDYYLDYLRGELFFTGRLVIDDDDRVRVDFEYQKNEYRKTLVTGSGSSRLLGERFSFDVGVAAQTAAGDDPLDFSLSAADKATLAAVGDDAAGALLPGAEFVGSGIGDYVPRAEPGFGEVYEYVGDSTGDFRVSFSESDTGDYEYLGAGEYLFVGKGLGSYLPVKPLPLPEASLVAGVSGQYEIASALSLSSEIAISDYDRNRFSDLDDGDNTEVAGLITVDIGDDQNPLSGRVSAEYLPAGFYRFGRLDLVQENYLWQRSSQKVGDRRRYQATATTKLTRHDSSNWEIGYTGESGGYDAYRGHLSSSVAELMSSRLDLEANMTLSSDSLRERQLMSLAPTLQIDLLPVRFKVAGEYDNQQEELQDNPTESDSRRALEVTASYAGLSLGLRQKENWHKLTDWEMQDRKRTLVISADRLLSARGRLLFDLKLNRLDSRGGQRETYQTGMFDLIYPGLAGVADINGRLRLNRRGRWQTNQTFLKVDEGEGDYRRQDSVYVADSRGDYILLTEQVGSLAATVEAEKQIQIELKLDRIVNTPFSRGTSFRYEVNLREIGDVADDFRAEWLLPPRTYFGDAARFSNRRHEYRLKRFDSGIGLRSELGYLRRNSDNSLDVRRRQQSSSEQGRLLLNKRIGRQDFIEASAAFENQRQAEADRYELNLQKRLLTGKASRLAGPWEISLLAAVGIEQSDSLDLEVRTYRLKPGLGYNLAGIGRATFAVFVFEVTEADDRPILLQLAGGFPVGTNYGGSLDIDINVGGSFDLRLSARGELRDGEDNRYYLRSELISRFK